MASGSGGSFATKGIDSNLEEVPEVPDDVSKIETTKTLLFLSK
jgi:hypothetical protein